MEILQELLDLHLHHLVLVKELLHLDVVLLMEQLTLEVVEEEHNQDQQEKMVDQV